MSLGDRVRREDLAARRALIVRRAVWAAITLALFLLVLFYFLLPMWRGSPQP